MALKFLQSVQMADIAIINRSTGQGVGYIVPSDVVIFLLWFLSSTTAQFIAVMIMAAFATMRQGWRWLTDWPAWVAGAWVIVDDLRNLGKVIYV